MEFSKLELFVFFQPDADWRSIFKVCLSQATDLLEYFDIEYRVVDRTNEPGYHLYKEDIEVLTKDGWLETHSCLYYGDQHSNRFDFTNLTHTIACTGLASPRILIPFMEKTNER